MTAIDPGGLQFVIVYSIGKQAEKVDCRGIQPEAVAQLL
jgi:hypothetical protein